MNAPILLTRNRATLKLLFVGVLIVTPYSGAVLRSQRRGLLMGAMPGVTYVLLYVLVSSRHLALLLGSLALLIAIAGLMCLTRGVDWYRYGDSGEKHSSL